MTDGQNALSHKKRVRIVLGDCDGILPQFEIFYIRAILFSAQRSVDAFSRFDELIKGDASHVIIIYELQEALAQAASVSRYFWPSDQSELAQARGNKLRDGFALSNDSPLRNRSLRNAIEHFNERLDQFTLGDVAGHIFDVLIDDHSLADEPTGHFFRLVDPYSKCFVLFGERYFFDPIRIEVEGVLDCAVKMERAGGRLQHFG